MSIGAGIILASLIAGATACIVSGHEDAAGGFVFVGLLLIFVGGILDG